MDYDGVELRFRRLRNENVRLSKYFFLGKDIRSGATLAYFSLALSLIEQCRKVSRAQHLMQENPQRNLDIGTTNRNDVLPGYQ